MNVKSLYESVTVRKPCSHSVFLSHLDMTVRTLIAHHKKNYVMCDNENWKIPVSINEDIPVYDEYYSAICNYILYALTGEISYKNDYAYEADSAYKSVWSNKARNKKIRDRGYYDV